MKRTDMQKNLQRLRKSLSSAAPPKKTIEKTKPTKTIDKEKTPSTLKVDDTPEKSQLKSKLGQRLALLSCAFGDAYYKLLIQILNIAVKLGYDTGFKMRGSVQMTLCATINLPEVGWVFYPINPPRSKEPDHEVSDETSAKRTDLFIIKALEKQEEDGYVLIGGMHEDNSPDEMQMWLVPNNDPKHREMIKYFQEVGLDEKYYDFLLIQGGLDEFSLKFPVKVKITEFIGLGLTF